MDEQRLQAYRDLIGQLMWCASDEAIAVLQQHAPLLDLGLLQVMASETEQLERRGNSKAAQRLQGVQQIAAGLAAKDQSLVATKLSREMTVAGSTENSKKFLREVLLLVAQSQGDMQKVYPFLAQHQDRLTESLLQDLPEVSAFLLASNPDQSRSVAVGFDMFGTLMQQFSLGQRWLNLELSIAAYEQVLTVITQSAMPVEWARTMMNLAIIYFERIRGDRAENIEQAIATYQQALTVRTQEAMPVEWAQTMSNLANAYCMRIRGEQADNIEQAIDAYKQVLKVRTKAAMPEEWATTMMNLAVAYSKHEGDEADNIEKAITAYEQALTVITQSAMPMKWAHIMSNLATTYSRRKENQADNIEKAINAYKRALTVRTKTAMPVEWATTMSGLAISYSERIRGERIDNIEKAIAAYQGSLEIFIPELFPNDCRRVARNLGNLYFEQRRWSEAALVYQKALQASEILYQSAELLDSQAAELVETADLPRCAAYALARTGNLKAAVLTLEQGRARRLSEILDQDRSDLTHLQQHYPDLANQYQEVNQQLHALETQQRLWTTSEERHSLTPETLRAEARRLHQTLRTTIEQIRQVDGHADFLAQPSYDDIRQAICPGIPLVYLVPTPAGTLALIATEDGIVDLWLDDLTQAFLQELLIGTGDASKPEGWFGDYFQAQSNHAGWLEAIDQGTHQLWQFLMGSLIDYLKHHSFQQATLISTGDLSLLPLHAAWTEDTTTPTGKRYALDEIHFTYAPNARSLLTAQNIAQRTEANSILAIDNPSKDLPNSSREVTAAVATFAQHKVLQHEQATIDSVLAALPHYKVLHLSCHGNTNMLEPLASGLVMSNGQLTLRDLLDLKLDGIRLAILSACATGLAGIKLVDEVISLPTGLLQSGVAGVVASLWAVSDLSTMLLLTRFYDLWRTEGLEISQALRQAQQWVRDTTNEEKIAYFKDSIPEQSAAKMPASTADYLYKSLILCRPNDRDFAHPFHWAAFSYTGV